MTSFIKELFYGNIDLQADTSPRLSKLSTKLSKLEDALNENQLGDGKELLAEFVDTYRELLSLSECESFEKGFRLGAGFAFDVMGKDK